MSGIRYKEKYNIVVRILNSRIDKEDENQEVAVTNGQTITRAAANRRF